MNINELVSIMQVFLMTARLRLLPHPTKRPHELGWPTMSEDLYVLLREVMRMFEGDRALRTSLLQSFLRGYLLGAPPQVKRKIRKTKISSRPKKWKAKLSAKLKAFFEKTLQQRDTFEMKMEFKREVHGLLQGIFREPLAVHVYGSSVTGLGTDNCDIDICVVLSRAEKVGYCESLEILSLIMDILNYHGWSRDEEVIRASVPILRFKHSLRGIGVDINIGEDLGIRNSNLLMHYAKVDWRLPVLALAIKQWARRKGICDAYAGYLSSYGITLMIVFYLQVCQPPVLPVLQQMYTHFFTRELNRLRMNEVLPVNSSLNTTSPAKLLLGFFKYYAHFPFEKFMVSVRQGKQISRTGHGGYIVIEEPFKLFNVSRTIWDMRKFNKIRQTLKQAYRQLRDTGDTDWI